MKISIAMATYNGADYLQEQLDSFAAQTRLPDELVVCDDHSSDMTREIIEKFRITAPFSVHIHINPQNLGYSQNFSKAMSLCKGDLVFISDQDDVWNEKKIQIMAEFLERNPKTQVLIHDLEYCNHRLEPIGQRKIERMHSVTNLMRDYVTGMATVIRTPFLNLCLPIPSNTSMTHDNWLHQCALSVDAKTIINDVLSLYRRHDKNTTAGNILNVAKITTPRDFFVNAMRAKLRPALQDDLDRSALLLSWMLFNREYLLTTDFADEDRVDEMIELSKQRMHFIKQRIHILSRRRIARVLPVMRQLASGGYRQFSGLKSAARDMLIY